MLDRALTQRIANAVSRANGARGSAPEHLPLRGDLAAICADAQRRVVAYTGLQPASPLPAPEAVQRSGWIAANVNSMGELLDPLGERLTGAANGGGLLRGPARAAAATLISAEAGAITGYLSQRVRVRLAFSEPSSGSMTTSTPSSP